MGAECWVLHPGNGTKPVAEGIAGHPHRQHNPEDGICRSLLEELCEDGQQRVKVTKMYKKNSELMFPEHNERSKFLDDYVTPPADSNTTVMWSTRFLSEKEAEV